MSFPRRKITTKDQPPIPMVQLRNGQLLPSTPYDAERMVEFKDGDEFDLYLRRKRSLRQIRLYWMILHRVVKATGRWPRAENLHADLKMSLNLTRMALDLRTGRVVRTPDSTAFDAMSSEDFNNYFQAAMQLLAAHIGFDPFDLLDGAGR